MKSRFLLFFFLLLPWACAPFIIPVPLTPSDTPGLRQFCESYFVKTPRRFVHSVEAHFPGGRKTLMMGVTLIYPETRTVRCVMMTLEGLVMLDAGDDGRNMTVHRAVPPFDDRKMAQGMMDDIRLIFLEPTTSNVQTGLGRDGAAVCRYRIGEEITVDLIARSENRWELQKFKAHQRIRSLIAEYEDDPSLPHRLELAASGDAHYRLTLRLMKDEPLADGNRRPASEEN